MDTVRVRSLRSRLMASCTSLPGSIATDADNIWNTTTQAAAVDGQVYSALVYDWWLDVFNRNSYTNSGATMLTVVNYSAEELRQIKGMKLDQVQQLMPRATDEAVHRDHMVLT